MPEFLPHRKRVGHEHGARRWCLSLRNVAASQRQGGPDQGRSKGEVGEDQTAEIREVKKEIAMKHVTVLLVAVLVFNSVAVAQATQTQGASQAAKVKTEVQKRGTAKNLGLS